MILNLRRIEASVLLLHMTIIRKNVRNGFKKRYDSKEYKELLSSYDEVKKTLESIFNEIDEDINEDPNEIFRFDYNVSEFKMLQSFLSWYVVDLEKVLNDAAKLANKNILDEDKKQLITLKKIKNKVKKAMEIYKIGV